ncbi:MAG: head GIN domain-containing protein [Flavobacterium sp.]|uniref:head GIN domain-containing protein n=1 Tax=Flavobacterium sp. TaxID=239 RepID=UPI003262E2B4
MKKLVFSLLLVSTIALAQETKNVGDFSKVTSFDRIDVFLVSSEENKVQIDGKQADEVELVNKNGELKIRMPLTKLLDGDNISVTVYFNNLTAVEANEGSRIACGDKISATSFDIIAKEGSEIKLILDVQKLNVKVKNGSIVDLQGNALTQDAVVNSGGRYLAPGLETNQTSINVTAGGEAHIFATDIVDAKVRAGGNITIHGEPKQINKDIVVGGTICEAKKK